MYSILPRWTYRAARAAPSHLSGSRPGGIYKETGVSLPARFRIGLYSGASRSPMHDPAYVNASDPGPPIGDNQEIGISREKFNIKNRLWSEFSKTRRFRAPGFES